METLDCYSDGASRGNPGISAIAFLVVEPGGEIRIRHGELLGLSTNNTAEYQAVIAAMEAASRITDGIVRIHSDSELVIRQLRGEYRIRKEHLRDLFGRVKALETRFLRVEYIEEPRENPWIRIADGICNRILDANRV